MKTMKKLLASTLLVCILTAMLAVPAAAAPADIQLSWSSNGTDFSPLSALEYRNEEIGVTVTHLKAVYSDVSPLGVGFEWSSGAPVATLTVDPTDNSLCTLTPTASGFITITVKSKDDPSLSKSFNVIVQPIPVSSVALNLSTLDFVTGDTGTLSASVLPDYATNKTVNWESSAPAVATVDAVGTVTAIAAGTATITATAADGSGMYASCDVEVKPSIKLNKSSTELVVGGSGETLSATVSDSAVVTWVVTSGDAVSVDASGTITPVKAGTATVTARADAGVNSNEADCIVNVKPSIKLNKSSISMIAGSAGETLTATVSDSAAVTWAVTDGDAVTVDSATGAVTPVKTGTATVTAAATANGQSNTANCVITVTAAPAVSITGDYGMELVFNHNEINKTTISKTAACDGVTGDFTWTVTGDDAVTLVKSGTNNSGCVITPKAVGTCEITVSRGADGASVPAKIKITVKGPELNTFSLSHESLLLEAGKAHKLIPNITFKHGTDATDANKAVKWSVSPEGKGITVESDGTVKVAGGTAKDTEVTVTCTSLIDSTKSASCKVKVVTNAPAAGTLTLTASPNVISSVGGYSTLSAKVGNTVISSSAVSWSVSGSSSGLATVNANGVVTPKASGDVIITGVYDDTANNIRYTGSVLVRIAPIVVYGNYSSYDRVNPLYFTTNEVIYSWNPAVDRVVVDGYVLTHGQHCYVASSPDGYVMVALNPVFLNQLSPAVVHTIQIGDPAAPASGYFRTYGYSSTIYGVKTGDESQPGLWAALCLMGILGASAILVSRRKDWIAKQ